MKSVIVAVILALAVSLPAFDNLDFEQIPPVSDPYTTTTVPGWQHIGANSFPDGTWNVNQPNLSGWAEAYVIQAHDLVLGLPWLPGFPIDGQFSMGFSADWPLLSGTTNNIEEAWIAQTGTIEADTPWLTLITDYTGPHTAYYPDTTNYFKMGYLTIYFDGTPVAFTLEEAGTGSFGQPLRTLRADFRPFAGQTGELRIGIEGPHDFVIDNIQLVPEPPPWLLLVAFASGTGLWLARPRRSQVPR